VRDDRALVLLAVPRALAPQVLGQFVETGERLDEVLGALEVGYGPDGA
jgi:hypothetical protein